MADSSDDVATLEHEVEEARERLAGTLAKLADPATQAAMKEEVMDYVHGYKDRLIGGTGQGIAADLKQRVMNAPLGVAMIGAGLAYRLYRHPPIATLLIGAGAALIARSNGRKITDPTSYRAPYDRDRPRGYVPGGVAGYGYPVEEAAPGSTTTDRMMATASQAGDRARELAGTARYAAQDAGSRISETAGRARETAMRTAEQARETAAHTAGRARETAQELAQRTREAAQDLAGRGREAAYGTYERARSTLTDTYEQTTHRISDTAQQARERATNTYESARANPYVLGAIGVAAGAAVAQALRSTETGDRFFREAPGYVGRGARGIATGAHGTARRAAEAASDVASSVTAAAAGFAESFSAEDERDERPDTRRSRGCTRQAGDGGRRRSGREDQEDLFSTAADAASGAYRSAADAGRRGAEFSRRAAGQIGDLAQNYPLLLGAIGVALGAAAGLAMRPTESEDELVGRYSDALKERARSLAGEQYQEVLGAAEALADGLSTPGGDAADWETVIGGGAPPTPAGNAGRAPSGRPSP
jgi:hypothetical protein